jgi:hypothetical protein
MNADKLAEAAHPNALSTYLVQQPMSMHHHGAGAGAPVESRREAEHNGHQIVIRTTYQVEIDGQVVDLPLGVDNDGHVHCHSLPNYQFNSAIDMIKQVLDTFPGDFGKPPAKPRKVRPVAAPMAHHEGMHMSMRPGKAKVK